VSQNFDTTRWTLVLDAANADVECSRPALETLCRAYWPPLYAYARRSGKNHEDAQDSIQSFFAHLLSKNLPGSANPASGRFRTFLISSLRHFMLTEHRDATTQKRGRNVIHLPMDMITEAATDCCTADTPEAAYERKWAHTLVNIALNKLAEQQSSSGNQARFALLRPLLLDMSDSAAIRLRLTAEHGMTTGSIRTALTRLRARFRDILRQEVSQLVDDPAEVDDEISYLLKAMG
jgi:RNA polymerase sigma factor (sigma-70 family)